MILNDILSGKKIYNDNKAHLREMNLQKDQEINTTLPFHCSECQELTETFKAYDLREVSICFLIESYLERRNYDQDLQEFINLLPVTLQLKSMRSDNLKYGLVLLALVLASSYLSFSDFKKDALPEFEQWKIRFNVKYESEFENAYREKIFLEKKAMVEFHNSNPGRTYNKGLNRFSAMTHEEFKATYLTLQSDKTFTVHPSSDREDDSIENVGDIDWRALGAVTAVKDQGHCGSCWSFSSTGGLEGLNKITTGTLKSFSEQQLMDCVTLNNGCHGGQMRRALLYVKDNGILQESEYPYKAVQGDCLKPKGDFKLAGYVNVSSCNELTNALTKQPIMVGLNSENWSDYDSGIFNGCSKQRGVFNHGVLVVGSTKDYWIVKNSWTADWGEKGYIRLAKGDSCNVCDDGMLLQ